MHHFAGNWSLATYAAYEPQDASKWLCLDADENDGRVALLELQGRLQRNNGWESLYELSRRGAHLWIFLDPDSHYRSHALRLYRAIQQVHFYRYRGRVDVFPNEGGLGGCVRLPLGVHRKSGLTYPVRDHRSGELLYREEALRYIASLTPVSTTRIIARYL